MASADEYPTSFLPEPSTSQSEPQPSPPLSMTSSHSSSESEDTSRRSSRIERPRMASRKASASIVVHKSNAIEIRDEEYPPDDARAMSPRRNSEDLERLGREARQSLKEQAKTLQSSLQALADRIDEVRSDHDKLESENKFLQDYIGGLTRTMSQRDIGSGGKSKK